MNFRPNFHLKKSENKSRNNHIRILSNPIELSHTYINQFNNTFNPNKGNNSPIFKTIKSYASIKLKNDKNLENLLSNYLYISPNVDSNNTNVTNYENFMSKTKKNFYNMEVPVCYQEIAHCLDKTVARIETAVLSALENTPPELYADIVKNGIYLTGGGALLRGLDKRLTDKINIPFIVAEDPLHCVAKGAGVALKNVDRFSFLMR